jgi:hypothetical protein
MDVCRRVQPNHSAGRRDRQLPVAFQVGDSPDSLLALHRNAFHHAERVSRRFAFLTFGMTGIECQPERGDSEGGFRDSSTAGVARIAWGSRLLLASDKQTEELVESRALPESMTIPLASGHGAA